MGQYGIGKICKLATTVSVVFLLVFQWALDEASANAPVMCAPYETTMKFGGYLGEKSVEKITLTIFDHNIRKCATFRHKAEPPRYQMIFGIKGRQYAVPDHCITDFVFDYDTTYVDPSRQGGTILLRGQSYPEGEVEDRLFWLFGRETKTEFGTGTRHEIKCSHWCKGEECDPIH